MIWARLQKLIFGGALNVTWPDLATLTPLLGHLSSLGEIYLNEIDRRSQVWLSILSEPGWIVPLADYGYSPTARFLDIATELSTIDRQRYICFPVPAYRRYLIASLTEVLIKSVQVNYYKNLA